MKRYLAVLVFLLYVPFLLAQEEVTFKFTRGVYKSGRNTPITLSINGVESVALEDGDTVFYKTVLNTSEPVVVLAKYPLLRKEITFTLDTLNNCHIEASLFPNGISLLLRSGGEINLGTGMFSKTEVNRDNLSVNYTYERDNKTDTIRQNWLKVGGKISYKTTQGNMMFLSMTGDDYSLKGYGGGVSVSNANLNFKVPEYEPGIKTWYSSIIGATVSIDFAMTTMNFTGMDPMRTGALNESVSLDAGYTIGFGKFKSATKWKGIAFEFTYKPSLIYNFPFVDGAKGQLSFNYMGFGLGANFNSFSSNASLLAPKAQTKIAVMVLPPIKDIPLSVSVGIGITDYWRR